jgi:ribosomal protein S18 acetylase RimI-like enzyme
MSGRPSDRFVLRGAAAADVPAIRALIDEAYAKYVPRIGKKPAPMLADYEAHVRAGEVHVLARDAQILGAIVLRAASDHLFVDNVAVLPGLQGQGLGRRLMAFAVGRAREAGMPAIHLYTHERMTENLGYYVRLGFREIARRHEDGYDRVYFEKTVR